MDKAGKGGRGTVDLNIGIGAQDQFHFLWEGGRGWAVALFMERRGGAAEFLAARGDSCFFMGGRGGAVAIFMRGTERAVALFKAEGREIWLLYGFELV